MYQIEAWSAFRKARRQGERGPLRRLRVHPNVWALGVTSLLTDVSSEMVSTVLPIYLVLYLGLSPLQFGIVDGLHHGVSALLRLGSGFAVDRSRRCKEIAFAGYSVSAASKLGLLAAGASWPLITTVVALDRAAKGLRTVPRDTLISWSSRPDNLATSFGVHRALDSAGAMLGPLAAMAILATLPQAFDIVFVSSFSMAVCGLGVLLLFVRNIDPVVEAVIAPTPPLSALRQALRLPGLARLTMVATALSAATISDGFIYLLLQRQVGFSAGLFPLLYVGTAACYLALAVPAGRIADVVGRRGAFLGGYLFLALAYLLILRSEIGPASVYGCLLLLGAYYALTEGVLMALASALLPTDRRGSGLAVLTTGTSVARLFASVLFGVLWIRHGTDTAIVVFMLALVAAIVITQIVLRADDSTGQLTTPPETNDDRAN